LCGVALCSLGTLAFSGSLIQPGLASDANTKSDGNSVKNVPRLTAIARVDCITPDGRPFSVPSADEQNSQAPALIMAADTLRCRLQEGETIFIVAFPRKAPLDRFTFINENAEVQGEMKIAVSNSPLPAHSPKWTDVSGKTEFAHRRFLNLSLVGIEAHYVKLSFHVEKGKQIASLGF
jgi:hypothetical protein